MTIDDKIRDKKLKYDISRVTVKQQKYQHDHMKNLINKSIF